MQWAMPAEIGWSMGGRCTHALTAAASLVMWLVLLGLPCRAQDLVAVSGCILDSASRETLPSATVQVLGTPKGSVADNYGRFTLLLLPGRYQLEASYVGYRPNVIDLDLTGDTTLSIRLGARQEIEQVVISHGVDRESSRSARMGTQRILRGELEEVPMLLGERDVLRLIQLMPGVNRGSEVTGDLYVRGGGPEQNLFILDGAPIYNVSHLFGIFSMFNGDALKHAEFIKGGFPARYGGRLSSVIDITTQDGNLQGYHGAVSLGLIASRLKVEGPIVKDKAGFLVTGRRSYADLLVRPFFKKEDGRPIFYFYDLTAKLHWRINARHTLYLSGYFGQDRYGLEMQSGPVDQTGTLGWRNAAGTLRWNQLYTPTLFSDLSVIYSHYHLSVTEAARSGRKRYNQRYHSKIQDLGVKWDFSWHALEGHQFRFGASWFGYGFEPKAILIEDDFSGYTRRERARAYSMETAFYAEDNMRLWGWGRAELGVRGVYYLVGRSHQFSLEPRLSASFYVHERVSLKASWTMMAQHMHLLTTVGIGLPTDLWIPATAKLPLERSWQGALGVTYDVPVINATLTVEGYYKQSRGAIHYREGGDFMEMQDMYANSTFYWEDRVTRGRSWSAGLEVLLRRKEGRLTGWLSYTLSWTRMHFADLNLGQPFWAPHDSRHAVNAVLMFKINTHWSLSGAWVFSTGKPFCLPESSYTGFDTPLLGLDWERVKANSTMVTHSGPIDALRMEAYHRLDLGIKWHTQGKRAHHTLSLDVYNVYYHKNPFFYYVDTYTVNGSEEQVLFKQSLIPVLPSLSYQLSF